MSEFSGVLNKARAFYDKTLESISSGNFFQKGFYYFLRTIAVLFAIGAVYSIFSELFEAYGYYEKLYQRTQQGAHWFLFTRGLLVSILSLGVSLILVLGISYHLWKRAGDIRDSPFRGLFSILIQFVKYAGELVAMVPIPTVLILFFSVLFVAPPFIPEMFDWFFKAQPGMIDFLQSPTILYNSIDSFGTYLKSILAVLFGGALSAVLSIFIILFLFYLIAEILEVLLHFFLRIPLYDRKKGQRNPDTPQ